MRYTLKLTPGGLAGLKRSGGVGVGPVGTEFKGGMAGDA